MSVEDFARLMATFDLFRDYTPHGTNSLISRGQIRELPDGHSVFSQGQLATTVVLVLRGEVEHFVVSHGREVRLSSAGPSRVLADVQVLAETAHPASARTVGDVVLLAWDAPTFRRLVASDSLFAQRVFHQTAVSLAQQAETLTASLAAIRGN